MGLHGCYSCMKYLFVFLNIIFLIFGVLGLAISIWMFVDPTFSIKFTQQSNDYVISIIILLIASIILIIIGILGIHSSIREVRWAMVVLDQKDMALKTNTTVLNVTISLLITWTAVSICIINSTDLVQIETAVQCFSLLLIIVVAEISAGVWGYWNREALEDQIRSAVKETVQKDYYREDNIQTLFDTFQSKLHCCGAEKATDWLTTNEIDVSAGGGGGKYNIPPSCCKDIGSDCDRATQNVPVGSEINYNVIYEQGCYTLILQKVRDSVCIILGVGGAILAIQLLGLLLALTLAIAMNRSNRLKG